MHGQATSLTCAPAWLLSSSMLLSLRLPSLSQQILPT